MTDRDRPAGSFLERWSRKKIENELGWRPKIPLEEGLRRTVEFFRARASG